MLFPILLNWEVSQNVRENKALLVLVAPVRRSQPWYPALLELLTDFPLILLADPVLPTISSGEPYPLIATGHSLLEAIRCRQTAEGISEKTSHLLAARL